MTTELNQVMIANGLLILTSIILTPILIWVLAYSWRNSRSPE